MKKSSLVLACGVLAASSAVMAQPGQYPSQAAQLQAQREAQARYQQNVQQQQAYQAQLQQQRENYARQQEANMKQRELERQSAKRNQAIQDSWNAAVPPLYQIQPIPQQRAYRQPHQNRRSQ